jgi:hypothetical protein
MTLEKLIEIHQNDADKCLGILEKANLEYSTNHDALDNFYLVSKLLGDVVSPKQVAAVYMSKHIIGIMKAINGNLNQRDTVAGRIHDTKNYLTLMHGLFIEDEKLSSKSNQTNYEPTWDRGV